MIKKSDVTHCTVIYSFIVVCTARVLKISSVTFKNVHRYLLDILRSEILQSAEHLQLCEKNFNLRNDVIKNLEMIPLIIEN